MPYKLVGGARFYERREIKDIIAYLRVIHNPADNISLTRIINVPGRGIGTKTLAQLSMWSREQGISLYSALALITSGDSPLTTRQTQALTRFYNLLEELRSESYELNILELLNLVVERSEYKDYILEGAGGEERWENILELGTVANEYRDLEPRDSLSAFLEGITLVSDIDSWDEEADAATLITLHQAKGLEFPVVFIVGVEEGLLPHYKSLSDPEQLEEERRLCYVGITRAKERVYLTHALRRSLMGSSSRSIPSRFLRDIPAHLVTPVGMRQVIPEGTIAAPRTAAFKEGDRVLHSTFGEGLVINCIPTGDDYELTIVFRDGKIKRFLESMTPLERVS
jgi:DNA helicase-2/ATP-dependent DNA helicase PcrA